MVHFTINEGNGSVDSDIAHFNNGFAVTKWKTGDENIQLLQFDIFVLVATS